RRQKHFIHNPVWILVAVEQPLHDSYRSEEHTSELQSLTNLVCRLLLEKKKKKYGEQQRRKAQGSRPGTSTNCGAHRRIRDTHSVPNWSPRKTHSHNTLLLHHTHQHDSS